NLLAEAVGVEQLVGADADRVEPLEQSQLREFLDRVRQRVDADAEFPHRLRLLVDLAVDAASMQHERGGEPTHPAAHDDGFHERRPCCPLFSLNYATR